ncbi:MAG: tRNA-guanine transglycosylase, partial [Archaeoglobaceae archaeon]
MKFKIVHTFERMRVGEVTTIHGSFKTPVFIPVATLGAMRGLDNRDLKDMGVEI